MTEELNRIIQQARNLQEKIQEKFEDIRRLNNKPDIEKVIFMYIMGENTINMAITLNTDVLKIRKILSSLGIPICHVCGDELTSKNWLPKHKEDNTPICRHCSIQSNKILNTYNTYPAYLSYQHQKLEQLEQELKPTRRYTKDNICRICKIKLTDENRYYRYKLCKECGKQKNRDYYKVNRERITTNRRDQYQKNADKMRTRSRENYRKIKELDTV